MKAVKASPEKIAEALRASAKEAEGLRRRNRELREAAREPIAIVGMACRYPGGVSSPQELWQLVAGGVDAISEFPSDRGWDLESLYDPEPGSGNTVYTREGGFLADAGEFDAEFFRISPREALTVGPQERQLLEACWEAFEDAGVDPATLRGEPVGVFAGAMYQDYGDADEGAPPGMTASGVSGRVSYGFGLEGPAMTVDTACSSSLVAMHLAAQALRGDECRLALAGGVTVLSTPGMLVNFSAQRGLAPDGRCKAFAESADGAGFSEGVGVLVLERLSDAERNGHRVLATIRGSAVNQDGASNGLTAPNGPSQERVIERALANAGLEAKDVDAVEAHGTGTTLGDPIEAGAILATYSQDRERPLRLGSIKSNIGHAQAAAGVAGVIKMTMAMRAGVLPKTLHVDAPSSKVDWEAGGVQLLTEPEEWESAAAPRRAGVSSFGASGTNAHLILEEAPESAADWDAGPGSSSEADGASQPGPRPYLLPLSAKGEGALAEQAKRLAAHLREDEDLDLADVAYSLATTRSAFEHRAVAVGSEREDLIASLSAFAKGEEAPSIATGKAPTDARPVFLFGGQGSQHAQMALGLLESDPSFANHIDACEQALAPHVDWSLREVLSEEQGKWMDRLDIVQPALFAVMVSLARLWEERGVKPSLVAGHSQGEIAAAHIAGALSLEDAALVIAERGKAMAKIAGRGGMLSVSLSESEVEPLLEPYGQSLSLAAINGPASLVVSGEPQALEELQAKCEADGIRAQRIAVDYAAHSSQIEDLRDELIEAFKDIEPKSADVPFFSTVDTQQVDTAELGPEYWYRNLRQTVRLEPVVRSLLEKGQGALIEISPHPVLSFSLQETIDDVEAKATVIPTLRKDQESGERFALSLAQAQASGAKLDWSAYFQGTGVSRVSLPTYAFQRKRYWLAASSGSGDPSAIGQHDPDHPLLSATIEDPSGEGVSFTGRISLASHPWLADHAVSGTVLLPGTAFVELALRAAEQVEAQTLEELTLQAPLVLPEQDAVAIQVTVDAPDEEGRREVSIHSRPDAEEGGEWTAHAQGLLSDQAPEPVEPLGEWPPPGAESLEVEYLYDRIAEAGFEYGPAFQGLTAAWKDGETIYAEVELPEERREEASRFGIHPALLDAAGHAMVGLALDEGGEGDPSLPFSWRAVRFESRGAASLRVRLAGGSFTAFDTAGRVSASVGSLVTRPVDPSQLQVAMSRFLHRLRWQQVPLPEAIDDEAAETIDFEPAEGLANPADAARANAEAALEQAQRWLARERDSDRRLVLVTEGAVAAVEGDSPDLALASVWGLMRSAQAEHPGRFSLVDSDGSETSLKALPAAIAAGIGEPQLALREGRPLAPRLERAERGEATAEPIDPECTVLVTGGTGGLGAAVARHLVERHGAQRLLLVSRSGEEAEGAGELRAELEGLGAEVTIAACDVADRARLASLIESIPGEHPLGAVIHSAAVLEDGTLESLEPERVERVFAPKADAAWHLHELTAALDLSHFVLFSSVSSLLGSPGQANYTAANAFLDALAVRRCAEGLPATSLAWGALDRGTAMTDALGATGAERAIRQVRERLGLAPMAIEQALDLLDAALDGGESLLAPVAFDTATLRSRAREGRLSPLLRGLVRVPAGRSAEAGSLAQRLSAVDDDERAAIVLGLVRANVAAVLGHASAAAVDPERAFKDLGFDSLGAVELRNRLATATGLRLPATLVFDYPNATALSGFLLGEAGAGEGARGATVAARASSEEPIAIVGMACRYPGGVSSPQELWQLVAGGVDAISGFPSDRGWDMERLYDPEPGSGNTVYTREGGFLADAGEFDAEFFRISPREALAMDPQERLLLEACWEALEDAGIDPATLRGEPVGAFAGAMYQDYGDAGQGVLPGLTSSGVSGRVSYTLGLEGPAMTVDTACSSSLVCVHLAAQALRGGECGLALAGGVTAMATPNPFVEFSRQRGLAVDGRCKAFAEAADGTGFSEGVGVLALERLSDAERNGHRVLATIRGSAINHDGASNGITAPNGPSQERVIRQALANANLTTSDVDAVEAHGTGTTLGDPIEAGALLATYGQDREAPLRLGSIKSNIGHAQAAAGVAGVIKMTMAMRAGVMPKTLHVDAPSSKVDWEAGEVELLAEEARWEPNGHPRRAGVSSFGASGTNAHLILEEGPGSAADWEASPSPSSEADGVSQPGPRPYILSISAKGEEALRDSASRLVRHLRENPEQDLADVAYSLAMTRSAFEHRAVAVGSEREDLIASLTAFAKGEEAPSIATGKAPTDARPVFLFGGQGSQHAQMALGLLESDPSFANHIDACEQALAPHVDWSLREVLSEGQGAWMERLDIVQPALFAVMVSLARLWEERGMKPSLVAGHSQGEIAAAHIAGALSLEDAALVIAERGKAMAKIAGRGGMLSVSLSEGEVEPLLEPYGQSLSLAAINGPASLVVSGEPKALEELQAKCEADGIRAQRIAVDYAAHSTQIEALRDELIESFKGIEPKSSRVPFFSTVEVEQIDTAELGPEYWYRNLRQTVRLEPVVRLLLEKGQSALIEISPHPVLSFSLQETIDDVEVKATVIPTLRKDQESGERFGLSLAQAQASGAKLDWATYFQGSGAKRVPLPTYPFQRKRFWLTASAGAGDPSAIGQHDPDHPLLSATIEDPSGEGVSFTGRISLASHPWLADHAVSGTVLLPGTAFVELALRAAEQVEAQTLEELTLQAPLVLQEQEAVAIQVTVGAPDEEGRREVSIHSRPDAEEGGEWTAHAQGLLSDRAPEPVEPLGEWPPKGAKPIEVEDLYDRLAEAGFEYGPAFQGLTAAWKDGETIYAEVSLPEELREEAGSFGIHPALLDAAGHITIERALSEEQTGAPVLPFAWNGVSVAMPGASSLRARLAGGSLTAFAESGAPLASVGSLVTRPVDPAQLRIPRRRPLYRVEWLEVALQDKGGEALFEVLHFEPQADHPVTAAHANAATALRLAQDHVAAEGEGSRLVVVTEGAIAAGGDESPDPALAVVWGLLRSAQAEHPGRFALIDSDGSETSARALAAAAAMEGETQIALREGRLLAPRLSRLEEPGAGVGVPSFAPGATAMITGGTSGLGALVARHLAAEHGARHLLLVSRSGEGAEGAGALRAELEGLGAQVTIAACDVADRERLAELIESIPGEHPLGAVIHSAAALEDGMLASLERESVERVFAPKADAAWHLHELTAGLDLSHFVLFSSVSSLLGSPGQANYTAANAFLDALAVRRRAEGLPATSLAWGALRQGTAMTDALGDAGAERATAQLRERLGVTPIPPEQALELFDEALENGEELLAPAAFDAATLRARAGNGMLPPLLRGLVRVPAQRQQRGGSLKQRLTSVPEAEREAVVLDLVRTHVAAVLGHGSIAEIDPERAFKDLGFDSLAAVELRNRLGAVTGMRLPATMVFDHPSATALTRYLLDEVGEGGEEGVEAELGRLESSLSAIPVADPRRAKLAAHLRSLAGDLEAGGREETAGGSAADRLESVSDEELLEFIDEQVGPASG